jgi:esterase/lipase superfamily enzyme/outer membrane protein OmpA-like peptidoglycan-associated protein
MSTRGATPIVLRVLRRTTPLAVVIATASILIGCSTAPAPIPPSSLPEPAPSPSPPPPPPVMAATTRLPADVFFDAGKTTLKPEGRAKLDAMLQQMERIDLEAVLVVGHSDASGSEEMDDRLSRQRSQAVKAYLEGAGVDPKVIFTEGKGSRQPVSDNVTAQGRAKNRRAEIEVVGTGGQRGGIGDPIPSKNSYVWKPNDTVPVLFGTNRQPTGSNNPFRFYGNQLADGDAQQRLRRGVAVIRVPRERQRGEVARPGWVRITLERATKSSVAVVLGVPPVEAANLLTEFSYARPIEELSASQFAEELRSAVAASKSKTAVLYVHGYANDFTDAAFRTAQFTYDLGGPDYDVVPLMFSWPSDPGLVNMDYDEARRRVSFAGFDLARFLEEVVAATDIGTIHLVAHSMGAEVLGQAMLKLGVERLSASRDGVTRRPQFRQIVFAAPDVTARIFEDFIEPAIQSDHMVTTYGTGKDIALRLSTYKNHDARAGSVGIRDVRPKCVDTIDVSSVAASGIGHSTWAEAQPVLDDIRLVLRYGIDASSRGLQARRLAGGTIWTLAATSRVTAAQLASATKRSVSGCSSR